MKGFYRYCMRASGAISCFFMVQYVALGQPELKTKINQVISDSLLSKAHIGVSVRNAASGKIIYEYNGNKSFTPASNLKLLTTAAALSILGPDYTFCTKLLYTGEVVNGVFGGTFKVQGSGDPTLGSGNMPGVLGYQELIRTWVAKIKALGITSFEGDLVMDPLKYEFNPIPKDYTWGDIGNYYGAGSYGINIHDNQSIVLIQPGARVGDKTKLVSITPWDTGWSFTNHIYTGSLGSGDKSIIYASPYNQQVFAEGTIPAGNVFRVKGSIPDPAYLLAQLLITEMKLQGIRWKGQCKVLQPGDEAKSSNDWKTLHQQVSPSVAAIIKQTNFISNNLYAETLLKEISTQQGQRATNNSSPDHVKRYVWSIGVDTIGMVLRDGSGMSPFNSITPNQMTQLLHKMVDNKQFVGSLPVAGRDGTVYHICKGTGEKIRLKSGTMNGTTCYSGYIRANSGLLYSISFMVNKHEAKNKVIQKLIEKGLLTVLME